MAFEKKVPEWKAPGIEPPASLKASGFQAGYKPPADYFNWFWHGVSEALLELQSKPSSSSFVVNFTGTSESNYSIDKTFDEIKAAYDEGALVQLVQHNNTGSALSAEDTIFSLQQMRPNYAVFARFTGEALVAVMVESSGAVSLDELLVLSKDHDSDPNAHGGMANKADKVHSHSADDITSGTFSTDRLPTMPINKGGTNATTADAARTNLGAAPMYTYSTTDIVAGTTSLENGKLYFVYV